MIWARSSAWRSSGLVCAMWPWVWQRFTGMGNPSTGSLLQMSAVGSFFLAVTLVGCETVWAIAVGFAAVAVASGAISVRLVGAALHALEGLLGFKLFHGRVALGPAALRRHTRPKHGFAFADERRRVVFLGRDTGRLRDCLGHRGGLRGGRRGVRGGLRGGGGGGAQEAERENGANHLTQTLPENMFTR